MSNTAGDSGKTAVINAAGMQALEVVYCELACCPFSPRGTSFKNYAAAFQVMTGREWPER